MFLQTDKISFRPIEQSDLSILRDWRNDPELRARTRGFRPLNMLDQEKWWEGLRDSNNIMFLIQVPEIIEGLEEPVLEFIGVCGLTHIDWKNRSAELSWYIGDKDDRGKGLARHIIYLLCEYAFTEIGLHRFWGEVYLIDDKIGPMYQHLGFRLDGCALETYWWNGKWWPSAYISIMDWMWEGMREKYLVKTA